MSFLPAAITEAGDELAIAVGGLVQGVAQTAVDIATTPGFVNNSIGLADGVAGLVVCGLELGAKLAPIVEVAAGAAAATAAGGGAAVDDTALQAVVSLIDLFTNTVNAATQQLQVNDPVIGPIVVAGLQFINEVPLKFGSAVVCQIAGSV